MKKISLLFLVLILALVSCSPNIPDGPIKDFVYNISFDKTFEHVKLGYANIETTYTENDVQTGTINIGMYYSRTNNYFYQITEVSGSYVGTDYSYSKEEVLLYKENNELHTFKKTDGVLTKDAFSDTDYEKYMTNYFYATLTAGYHRDGMYYGDYVIANCAKYYNLFSLNDAKDTLTYKVNTLQKSPNGDEVVVMHYFEVDPYGMLKTLNSKSLVKGKNQVINTTIKCFPNQNFEMKKDTDL